MIFFQQALSQGYTDCCPWGKAMADPWATFAIVLALIGWYWIIDQLVLRVRLKMKF